MNFSFFNKSVQSKDYLPDSIYSLCGEDTQDCTICSNVVWSPVVNGYVHDSQNGKVFCPFGKGNSMNISTYQDQSFLVNLNPNEFQNTTWGRVPQLDPRPLTKVGLEWRTS
jgi:hypothetical protein